MKQEVKHEKYGNIVYEESFWTGKKSLSINDAPLTKVSKKEFDTEDGKRVTVTGGFFQGACLSIEGETVRVTPKIKWYEIILGIIPFILIMVWGNSVALCKIIPVVGGAIGGFVSALISATGLIFIKQSKPVWMKILIAVCAVAAAFGICCGIGFALVAAMS